MIEFIKEIIKRELIFIKERADFDKFINIKNKHKVLFITEQAGVQ